MHIKPVDFLLLTLSGANFPRAIRDIIVITRVLRVYTRAVCLPGFRGTRKGGSG